MGARPRGAQARRGEPRRSEYGLCAAEAEPAQRQSLRIGAAMPCPAPRDVLAHVPLWVGVAQFRQRGVAGSCQHLAAKVPTFGSEAANTRSRFLKIQGEVVQGR